MRYRLVGLVAVVALILASCGGGAPEAAGPTEGIQVHGDWTIDIYNEDGTLDRSLAFSNAFTGAEPLTQILTREASIGLWRVALVGVPNHPCVNASGGPASCFVSEPNPSKGDTPDNSHNLEVSAESGVIVLSGTHSVTSDGEIHSVSTQISTCVSAPTPEECDDQDQYSTVTQKSMTSEPVSTGQSVQVEVRLSFTSGP